MTGLFGGGPVFDGGTMTVTDRGGQLVPAGGSTSRRVHIENLGPARIYYDGTQSVQPGGTIGGTPGRPLRPGAVADIIGAGAVFAICDPTQVAVVGWSVEDD